MVPLLRDSCKPDKAHTSWVLHKPDLIARMTSSTELFLPIVLLATHHTVDHEQQLYFAAWAEYSRHRGYLSGFPTLYFGSGPRPLICLCSTPLLCSAATCLSKHRMLLTSAVALLGLLRPYIACKSSATWTTLWLSRLWAIAISSANGDPEWHQCLSWLANKDLPFRRKPKTVLAAVVCMLHSRQRIRTELYAHVLIVSYYKCDKGNPDFFLLTILPSSTGI